MAFNSEPLDGLSVEMDPTDELQHGRVVDGLSVERDPTDELQRERTPMDEATRERVERLLTRIDGVEAVRVVAGTTRPIDELHALVSPDRSAKQVARDLQTLLATTLGMEIDRRVISIVQLDSVAERLAAGAPRVLLTAVSVTVRAGRTFVEVRLRDDNGHDASGCVDVPSPPEDLITVTAEAAVRALNTLDDGHPDLTVDGTELLTVGGTEVVIVTMGLRSGRSTLQIAGTAPTRFGVGDAAARAVLAATNRLGQSA